MNDRILLLPVAAAAGLAAAAAMQPLVDPRLLFLDPMIAGVVSGECCRSWYGFMSTLGVLIWIGTSMVCLFAAVLLKRMELAPVLRLQLVFAGLLSLMFGLDDVYLIHENAAPKLGIPQIVVLSAYLLMAMAYVAVSWRRILAFNTFLFLLAGGLLGVSLAFDLFGVEGSVTTIVWEDGAKFAGIAAWASYHTAFASVAVRAAVGSLDGVRQQGASTAVEPVPSAVGVYSNG